MSLAAAFLSPIFLWGGLLIAVPLIIHLLNRRRFRTVTWAAMEFVLQAYKKKHRRMRIEHLLLLLLRCLIPLLLALAVARPFVGPDSLVATIADGKREVVVMLDASYSMNRRIGTGTAYQGALTQVRRLFDGLDPENGDTCTLVMMTAEPRILLGRSNLRAEWETALRRQLEPSFEEADFARAIDLLQSDVLPQIPSESEVYLFSDFQRRTFEPPLENEEAVGDDEYVTLRDRIRNLQGDGTSFAFINVVDGQSLSENVSVVDLRVADDFALLHQNLRFTVTVRSQGQLAPGPDLSGRFRIGETERQVRFALDKDGVGVEEIYHSFATPGDHAVEFILDTDDLDTDNTRSLRVAVREALPILVVDGEPEGADALDGEVGNLLQVLDPQYGDFEADRLLRRFDPKHVESAQFNLGRERLDDYEAVIVANVAELHERMVEELTNYAKRGGGVWFFLGDQVVSTSYNQRLYAADGSGLLPMPLAEDAVGEAPSLTATSRPSTLYTMEIVDDLHPSIRTFVDDERRELLEAPLFRYLPFEDGATPPLGMRVVTRIRETGAPALVDHSLGQGHVLWFTSPADDEWSLFADNVWSFFPFCWDVSTYLVQRDPRQHQLGIGDAIRKSVPVAPAPFTITKPDGEVKAVSDLPTEPVLGHFPLPPFDDTDTPGVYTLDLPLDAGAPLRELFAVNVDPQEGALESLDREGLAALLDPELYSYAGEVSVEAGDSPTDRQGEIWKALLTALLGVLVLETILAWRFGAYS